MIPKTIHYCWFGGNPLPDLAKKCIKSWKKYCKGYNIIEWNESNFDISSAPLYVRQAYEAKKWAFVTDYVRLWAMTRFGGIYMDTDVEIIRPLDRFLTNAAFAGFEDSDYIATAIMGCEKSFPLFVDLLETYKNIPFIDEDGNCNTTTNVKLITNRLVSSGLLNNNLFQIVDGFAIYPSEYFSPKSFTDGIIRKTKNTYSIHHFDASWLSKDKQDDMHKRWKRAKEKARRTKLKSAFIRVFGENAYNKLRKQ